MIVSAELVQAFVIELPEDEVQAAIHKKLETDHPTRGFRSVSKMPLSFIIKKYGEDFLAPVMQALLMRHIDAKMKDEGHDVVGIHVTSKWNTHDRPLRYLYEVVFEMYPKFELKGLDSLRINTPVRTIVDDEHIDACLQMVQRDRSTWRSVERPARRGDRLNVNFDSFLEDGQSFPGGRGENVNLELGSGSLLPEFENALLDALVGKTVDFPVTFPDNYTTTFLAGKTACFSVSVLAIYEFDLVPIDDKLAAACGVPEGLSAWRESTRIHLQSQHDAQDQREISSDLLRQFATANPIPLPPSIVARQLQELQKSAAEAQGVTLEQAQIDDSLIDQAQYRAQLSVLARRLILQHGIPIADESDLTEQIVAWLKDRAAKNSEVQPA